MSKYSDLLLWSRPSHVPFPNVWAEFVAKESKDSDKLVKYRIQDLPEDRFDEALQHLKENYLLDEPLSMACDGINSEDYVDDYQRLWRGAFEQKLSIVCIREDSDEIVGVNVLIINSRNDSFMQVIREQSKNKYFIELLKIFDICYATFSPYEKYGAEKFMGSLGLSVDRKCRGLALGTRLLENRARVAAPFDIKFTQTLFTSNFSNANADKAGFQLDVAFTYDELNEIDPDFQFTNMPSKRATIKTLIF